MNKKTSKPKGFAKMAPERQREIAAMGGKAAHEQGKAHRFNSETGRNAVLKRDNRLV